MTGIAMYQNTGGSNSENQASPRSTDLSNEGEKMRVLVEAKEGGLESLLGKKVILLCANYFYTGKLVGVNKSFVKLEDPAIVYETGAWTDSKYKDEQPLCVKEHYVRIPAIESFGLAK